MTKNKTNRTVKAFHCERVLTLIARRAVREGQAKLIFAVNAERSVSHTQYAQKNGRAVHRAWARLKHQNLKEFTEEAYVAHRARTWIETFSPHMRGCFLQVAHHARAWIETEVEWSLLTHDFWQARLCNKQSKRLPTEK